ncbi:DENN domain-containing protein 10-like [Schistocerca gregaria]|uniref:DENN domain-containing protein 10-like n=1 Tax=Schistocerca gregaria TaxID=7010 RepID=UPI00211ED290|nr:DENN domain-containing protein 10-like [Schistocerca gregaria]
MELNCTDLSFQAVAVIERDKNGDVLVVWCYPTLGSSIKSVSINRSGLKESINPPCRSIFSRFGSVWLYQIVAADVDQSAVQNIVSFCILVVSNRYYPEKYGTACKCLAEIYHLTGSTVQLLDAWMQFLEAYPVERYDLTLFKKLDPFRFFSIKDVINSFKDDAVYIWSTGTMKKRIALYNERLSSCLRLIPVLYLFAFCMQGWNNMRPYVTFSEEEIHDLKLTGTYLAGFTDPKIKERRDLYDLLIYDKEVIVISESRDFSAERFFRQHLFEYLQDAVQREEITSMGILEKMREITSTFLSCPSRF